MKIDSRVETKVKTILERQKETLAGNLGIEYLELSPDGVIATMPVDQRTKQPFGLLHGGASLALAETLASVGAWLNVDEAKFACVGIEINANHLKATRTGKVTGVGVPIHRGRSTHVWEVKISNEKGELVCISRCTLAVVAI